MQYDVLFKDRFREMLSTRSEEQSSSNHIYLIRSWLSVSSGTKDGGSHLLQALRVGRLSRRFVCEEWFCFLFFFDRPSLLRMPICFAQQLLMNTIKISREVSIVMEKRVSNSGSPCLTNTAF